MTAASVRAAARAPLGGAQVRVRPDDLAARATTSTSGTVRAAKTSSARARFEHEDVSCGAPATRVGVGKGLAVVLENIVNGAPL